MRDPGTERTVGGDGSAEAEVELQPVETGSLPAPAVPVPEAGPDRRPVLELRNVSTHYGLVAVLRNVDVQIYPGEMVCLLGGNASGKTTTLKTILGYVTPSEGEVILDGQRVSGLSTTEVVKRGVSMVPENRRLFPDMSVAENLQLGAYIRTDREVRTDVDRLFDQFPMLGARRRLRARVLSGGERRILELARVLLAEHPNASLSSIETQQFAAELSNIVRTRRLTALVLTADATFARAVAQQVLTLQPGTGELKPTSGWKRWFA